MIESVEGAHDGTKAADESKRKDGEPAATDHDAEFAPFAVVQWIARAVAWDRPSLCLAALIDKVDGCRNDLC